MDFLDVVKDKIEPQYIDGSKDVEETKVSKRKKIFSKQVRKGVSEMQVSLNIKTEPKLCLLGPLTQY